MSDKSTFQPLPREELKYKVGGVAIISLDCDNCDFSEKFEEGFGPTGRAPNFDAWADELAQSEEGNWFEIGNNLLCKKCFESAQKEVITNNL